MKGSTLVFICVLFTVALSRLSSSSSECNNYLKKFGTANSANGVGPTFLAYTGDAAIVKGTANVQVNLRYSDSLFNDTTYWGLTQEDGKTADATCLDIKLWKFSFSNFSDPVQVTDLPLTVSSNSNKKWRYLRLLAKDIHNFSINNSLFMNKTSQIQLSMPYLITFFTSYSIQLFSYLTKIFISQIQSLIIILF